MDIFFLQVHAFPTEDNPRVQELQGAYVNCWIKAPSAVEAEKIAYAEIHNARWAIDGTECPPTNAFERTESNADYSLRAQLDGECYVFHTYTADDDLPTH